MTDRKEVCRACEDAAKECEHRAFLCHAHNEYGKGREQGVLDAARYVRQACRHDDRDAALLKECRDLIARDYDHAAHLLETNPDCEGCKLMARVDAALDAEGRE